MPKKRKHPDARKRRPPGRIMMGGRLTFGLSFDEIKKLEDADHERELRDRDELAELERRQVDMYHARRGDPGGSRAAEDDDGKEGS